MLNLLLGLALLAASPIAQSADTPVTPAATAATDAPHGTVTFSVRDPERSAIPARLAFLGDDGPDAMLFPNTDAAPESLAVRGNTVYTLHGTGAVTVPVGTYQVIATHGPEWSVDTLDLEVTEGGTAELAAVLRHEVDTSGWVSADFHLHTLTYSGHGDANPNERIISVIGEGLEVAVATDHNHHTDYAPVIAGLGADGLVMPIVGNEVSTPLGHFNVFPVNPEAPVFPSRTNAGQPLFRLFRQHDSGVGVRTVIQVNHPRWGEIDYFGEVGLDPVTAWSDSPRWSRGFDSVEIFNENAGWGYYESGLAPVDTASGRHSVLEDWFNLLGLGLRIAAVGNSDSHSVIGQHAGYPRNYVNVPSDDVRELSVGDIAEAVRRQSVFTTLGPFIEFSVDDAPMGGTVVAEGGTVELSVRVRAASWVDCDRVIVVVNGDRVHTIPVPDVRTAERLDTTVEIPVDRDAFLLLLVEGDDPLAPVVPDKKRPILPLAVTNPVWIDAEGDGRWESPAARGERLVAAIAEGSEDLEKNWRRSPASGRKWLLAAAARAKTLPEEIAREFIRVGLRDPIRRVRIAACGLADLQDDPELDDSLLSIVDDRSSDDYLRVRALVAVADPSVRRGKVLEWLERRGAEPLRAFDETRSIELPGRLVRSYRVLGYLDVPADGAPSPAPETEGPLDRTFAVRGGESDWRTRETRSNGYLDLLGLHDDPTLAEHALAYAEVWVESDGPRSVPFALGTDDGCVFLVNGESVVADTGTHGADPLQHFGRLALRDGWNRLLLRVENGRGGFGAYLRILDDRVRIAPRPDTEPTSHSESDR